MKLTGEDRDSRQFARFETIVARHGPMVFRVALRVLGDHHEAEDAMQLTFIELAKHPEVASPHLAGWLHRTAANAATDLLRSKVRRTRREAIRGREDAAAGPRRDEVSELREEIDRALGRLPDDLREAVVLHHLEGHDFAESARLAGCSEEALRKRSQRGLRRLRDHLVDRGVVCRVGSLALFLGAERAASADVSPDLLARLDALGSHLPPLPLRARPALGTVLGAKLQVLIAALALAGGMLGALAVVGPARWWSPDAAPVPGWSAEARARFLALPIAEAATADSTRPLFDSRNGGADVLVPPLWGEITVQGIPFRLADPRQGPGKNIVALHSTRGDYSRRLPEATRLRCGRPARAIHLLSGVSGWGYPVEKGHTISMVLKITFAGGSSEIHNIMNGAHFASYAGHDEVPGSRPALRLAHGHQMRLLSITPSRSEPIDRIEFLRGDDQTCPVVMAVTIERGTMGQGQSALPAPSSPRSARAAGPVVPRS
jgi:RNA polymerase sigma factor (sigma-70 family)